MSFWVYGEDLVSGLVGPFATAGEANVHIGFCRDRGDADPGMVVTDAEADRLRPVGIEMTPEADRAFVCPD